MTPPLVPSGPIRLACVEFIEMAQPVDDHTADRAVEPTNTLIAYQFMVAIYGGYFGAGIGILMLARSGSWAFATFTA